MALIILSQKEWAGYHMQREVNPTGICPLLEDICKKTEVVSSRLNPTLQATKQIRWNPAMSLFPLKTNTFHIILPNSASPQFNYYRLPEIPSARGQQDSYKFCKLIKEGNRKCQMFHCGFLCKLCPQLLFLNNVRLLIPANYTQWWTD